MLVAPNTGGESFGIVLVEAMAAGAAVLASDLPAFRRVLGGGAHGVLVPPDDPAALAAGLEQLLDEPGRRAALRRGRPRGRTTLRLVHGDRAGPAGLRDRRHPGRGGAMTLLVTGLLVALVLGLALWLSWTANRLDRLHHRIDVARARLDAELLRRSGVSVELAATDLLDPASRVVLLDAAHRARASEPEDLEQAESDLSAVLRAVLAPSGRPVTEREDPEAARLLDELAGSCARVELARRFHNDAVVTARALRSRRRVRWLRLAGRAADLRTVDLDDVPPAGRAGTSRRDVG